MQNKIYITIFVSAVVGILLYSAFVSDSAKNIQTTLSEGSLEVKENNFNFGEILLRGGDVSRRFLLVNGGEGEVVINKIYTSCMCTTAFVEVDGKRIGPFGMEGHGNLLPAKTSIKIPAGEEIELEAVFDPYAHGPNGLGKIIREIYLETNSSKTPIAVVKFEGDVVNEFSKVNGPSLLISEQEHDFGIIKQSGGIVSKKFDIINNGTEKVIISSLPASCACTSAEIDKKEINPEERASITVFFDPNLHQEPEGRFFKTIEIVSNLEKNPELKIYAEIDLDLGPEFFKLKEEHID